MKKIWKLSLFFILTPFFLTACGSKNNNKFTISFGGVGVTYERQSDLITNQSDYKISAKAINGYQLDESDFTITVGKNEIVKSDSTWNWINDVLTIKNNIIKDDIIVSATAQPITYNVKIHDCEGVIVEPYEPTVNALSDFVLKFELTLNNYAVLPTLKFYDTPSNNYELTSKDSVYYVFKIKKEYICGDINLSFVLIENEISVSTTSLSMITYGTEAITYALPKGVETDLITCASSTDLFDVKQNKTDKTIEIASNENNRSGTGTINFKYNNVPLATTVTVTITKPQNMQEAYDAFTLAAIKTNSNTTFAVDFDFDNIVNISDFNDAIEIYGRRSILGYNYDIGRRTNFFSINKTSSYATIESEMIPGDQYYRENVENINYLNRKISDDNSRILYIDTVNRTLAVDNSEELFWAVEHNYRPIISVNNISLLNIYENARSICRLEVDGNFTNFEKLRILFEALESITHYDYWAYSNEEYDWWDYQAYFLEGVFNNPAKSYAVCDGFSKAYALLCGIEGLPCFRSCGFYYDSQIKKYLGHAWNYIQLDDNAWYLACPTACKTGLLLDEESNTIVSLMNYSAFGASKNYFIENESPFSDLTFPMITRSNISYGGDKSILVYDESADGHSYLLNSNNASSINVAVKNNAPTDNFSCVSLTYNSSDYNNLNSLIRTVITDVGNFDIYTVGIPKEKPTATHDECWILFIPNH